MKKSKSKSILFVIVGIMLIGASLVLVVCNRYTDYLGEQNSHKVLVTLKKEITSDSSEKNPENEKENKGEITKTIDSKKYIGIISVPKINLELPVLKDLNYDNLKVAPCRYFGSCEKNNLIIAAHNYTAFFDKIDTLNSGDTIKFTDVNGVVHNYQVTNTELISGSDSSAMKKNEEQWDITLFTCTWSGWSRVTVRATENS